jgi:NADH dehydrogenase FAD-containing subunit
MSKRLVLIGGGHAHMVTLARLGEFIDKGYQVTVIQPSEHHYYSGMGPGMLGGSYQPDDIRFATKKQVEGKGGEFVLARAYRIDSTKNQVFLEDREEPINYDILSCNAGSYVPRDLVTGVENNIFSAKPIEELQRAKNLILEKSADRQLCIAVLGSGPSSIEIAGNIHQLCHSKSLHQPRILLFAGHSFMSGRPARVQKLTRKILLEKGVEILQDGYVKEVSGDTISLENGSSYQADIIFTAIGVKPSEIFQRSGLATGPDGGLRVNSYLQSTDSASIFGGGDCIYFQDQPLDKVGVYAVRQNQVLCNNLLAALEGAPLEKFNPGGDYLLIYNLGDGQGVLSKWSITFSGRLAFIIKDYIDRKFIADFQQL